MTWLATVETENALWVATYLACVVQLHWLGLRAKVRLHGQEWLQGSRSCNGWMLRCGSVGSRRIGNRVSLTELHLGVVEVMQLIVQNGCPFFPFFPHLIKGVGAINGMV